MHQSHCSIPGGRIHTFDRNKAAGIERDIYVEHGPHAIDNCRMDNANRCVKVPPDFRTRSFKVNKGRSGLFVDVYLDTDLVGWPDITFNRLYMGRKKKTLTAVPSSR